MTFTYTSCSEGGRGEALKSCCDEYYFNDYKRCILVRDAVVWVIFQPPRMKAPASGYILLEAMNARLGAGRCGERNFYCSQVE